MHHRRIHIVEDNLELLELYRGWFEEAGYEVFTSSNGLSGIAEAADSNPEVILLDMKMPEMTGLEFIEAFKNNTSLNSEIIVMSNLSDPDDKQDALAAGADLYIVKAEVEGRAIVDIVENYMKELHS